MVKRCFPAIPGFSPPLLKGGKGSGCCELPVLLKGSSLLKETLFGCAVAKTPWDHLHPAQTGCCRKVHREDLRKPHLKSGLARSSSSA